MLAFWGWGARGWMVGIGLALAWFVTTASARAATRLEVVLVLDASGSMAANDPQKVVRMAAKMISDLADERDEVTVISFGSEIKTLAKASGDRHDELRSAIATLGQNESCTDYARALEAAAGAFTGPPSGATRRVVLFLTDGRFEPALPNGSCDRYEGAGPEIRRPSEERAEEAARRLKAAGARLFTIGLGHAPSRATDSKALLERVAGIAQGRFVQAMGPRDVPPIFASIFGAVVGAPVQQDVLGTARTRTTFEVPGGADRVQLVLVPDRASDLEKLTLEHGGKRLPFEPVRQETPSSAYQIARVVGEAAGSYALSGTPGGNVTVLLVPDVGLSLQIEGVPSVLPEGEPLSAKVALRTRTGQPVALAPSFLEQVRFTVQLGEAKLFDQRPDAQGVAAVKAAQMKRGRYALVASAEHGHGFLDVPPVRHTFAVEPRFSLALATPTIRFDTMAEPGLIPLEEPAIVKVTAPDPLPVAVRLAVELPEDYQGILELEPAEIVFAPEGPRSAELTFRFRDAPALRSEARRFDQPLRLVAKPDDAKLLVGERTWSIPIEAQLRAWTFRRYLEEYKRAIAIAAILLLLLVYLIGRVVAARFPPKARIHYVAVGEQFASDSLIKRHARRGAFRHASFQFPLGKKARPLAHFRSTGAGFEVRPAARTLVTILDDAVAEGDRERRKSFTGRWDQRYRLDDRYEVWLTRN